MDPSINSFPGQSPGFIPNSINGIPLSVGYNMDLINAYVSMVQTQQPIQVVKGLNEISVKGTWTVQEDELLKDAVKKLGNTKWTDIAKLVPSRTAKQCRERWHNRLSPELKHGPFEPWEDNIIIQRQSEIGNRWSLIANELRGRSPGSVKNRWYAGLKNMTAANDFSLKKLMNDPMDTSN